MRLEVRLDVDVLVSSRLDLVSHVLLAHLVLISLNFSLVLCLLAYFGHQFGIVVVYLVFVLDSSLLLYDVPHHFHANTVLLLVVLIRTRILLQSLNVEARPLSLAPRQGDLGLWQLRIVASRTDWVILRNSLAHLLLFRAPLDFKLAKIRVRHMRSKTTVLALSFTDSQAIRNLVSARDVLERTVTLPVDDDTVLGRRASSLQGVSGDCKAVGLLARNLFSCNVEFGVVLRMHHLVLMPVGVVLVSGTDSILCSLLEHLDASTCGIAFFTLKRLGSGISRSSSDVDLLSRDV